MELKKKWDDGDDTLAQVQSLLLGLDVIESA